MTTKMRLDRVLAQRGVGSRSIARKLVKQGRVIVDDVVAKRAEQSIETSAVIKVDDELLEPLPLIIVWHKPFGVVSTMRDPLGRHDLSDVLPAEFREKLHPVGRLDAETTGLLLFSLSGALTQWLLHPKRAIKRRYEAEVETDLSPDITETLAAGVATSLGTFTAEVEHAEGRSIRLGVVEGKHRMVRRLLANSGHPVAGLHRISYGPFELGDLDAYEYRPATQEELEWLEARKAPTNH